VTVQQNFSAQMGVVEAQHYGVFAERALAVGILVVGKLFGQIIITW